jgi:hypothetical protein
VSLLQSGFVTRRAGVLAFGKKVKVWAFGAGQIASDVSDAGARGEMEVSGGLRAACGPVPAHRDSDRTGV